MAVMLSSRTYLTLPSAEALARVYDIPVEDVLLMALNLYGVSSPQRTHRARLAVRLTRAPSVEWMTIIPLNVDSSPFLLDGEDLTLAGVLVAHVERIEADEAVGGYFRNDGLALTLNPNARSRCVGCAFCPNTLEAAADPRLAEERKLAELLSALVEQHPRRNLRELQEVTVSTGCFEQERAAIDHLVGLRSALTESDIAARIGFLTSVIATREGFEELAAKVSPFVLRLTIECFSRRDLMLKASKAALKPDAMPDLLRTALATGLDTSYTYIVGLDSLAEMRQGVAGLAEHISEFPNFQVYQAHNSIMAELRSRGAEELSFYLQARKDIEELVGPTGLRPVAWECYRPLWFFTFADELLVSA